MDGTDQNIEGCLFAWVVPLISIWPPPLTLGQDVLDNTTWDFKLLNWENGRYKKALHALVK